MCGIVGVAGNIGTLEEKAFKTLLEIDTVRGPDSTGIIVVTINGDVRIQKCLGTPWNLYPNSTLFSNKGIFHGSCDVLIGHNRWATTGEVNIENTHPFIFGKIVGVHNGTLSKHHLHKLEDSDKFDVDSQVLFHNINKYGIKKTIPNTCGAYSLVWYDKKTGVVNFLRNSDRPMCYMYTKEGDVVYWASEAWMISAMCDKHNIEEEVIIKTKPDIIYRLKPKEKDDKNMVWFKYGPGELKGLEPPTVHHSYSGSFSQYYSRKEGGKVWCYNKKTHMERHLAYNYEGLLYSEADKNPKDRIELTNKEKVKLKRDEKRAKKELKKLNKGIHKNNVVDITKKIDVYYDGDDDPSTSADNFIYMRECKTHKFVRLIGVKDTFYMDMINTLAAWEYFTVRVNSWISCKLPGKEGLHDVYICQGNSIDGPHDWESDLIKDDFFDDPTKIQDDFQVFGGEVISLRRLVKLLSEGCSWCSDNGTTVKDVANVVWTSRDEFICETCTRISYKDGIIH